MLELSSIKAKPELDANTERALAGLLPRPLGSLQIEGEIVDIKCWLGRMKPGDRTHPPRVWAVLHSRRHSPHTGCTRQGRPL